MKNSILSTVVFIFLLISSSQVTAQWRADKIVGNGDVTTKVVSTNDYDKIKVMGHFDVQLESGNEGNISVMTDENLHEYIIVEVKDNNTLVIRVKKNINLKTRKGIHITVPFKDISEIALMGSGEIESKDTIQADLFEVSLAGSGDLDLNFNVANLDAKVSGSGDMILSGEAKNFEMKLSGSGDFDGNSLRCENTQVYVSGSGQAKVTASERIKARVNGSGAIKYAGNPEIKDVKVSGSGSIKSH